jgi:hypothetical protein
MGNGPKYRITRSRKDKEDITFLDFRGEEVTKRHEPVAVIFENERGMSLKVEKTISPEDHETYWFNIYSTDSDDTRVSRRPAKGRRPARKPAAEDTDTSLDFD